MLNAWELVGFANMMHFSILKPKSNWQVVFMALVTCIIMLLSFDRFISKVVIPNNESIENPVLHLRALESRTLSLFLFLIEIISSLWLSNKQEIPGWRFHWGKNGTYYVLKLVLCHITERHDCRTVNIFVLKWTDQNTSYLHYTHISVFIMNTLS